MTSTDDVPCASDELVACYVNDIPSFVEAALVQLYGALHASLPFLTSFRGLEQANSYVVTRAGRVTVVLLFRCTGGRVDVLNEMMALSSEEIHRFARYIFTNFSGTGMIHFPAVHCSLGRSPFPTQKRNAKTTYVVTLPPSVQEYANHIGKKTMAGIRYQTNKLKKTFPSLSSKIFLAEEIDAAHVREIIRFSEIRINADDPGFSYDVRAICALAKKCGFLHVMFIDGRVCAGSVNYRIGDNYFGETLGQDMHFQKYSLGKLCVYQTICESIVRGGKKFYLGGGAFDFKTHLLGEPLCVDALNIYRSRTAMLRHLDAAIETVLMGVLRRLKGAFHRNRRNPFAKYVFKIFYFCRSAMLK